MTEEAAAIDPSTVPDPKEAITSKKDFAISCVIFACAVAMLVTHAQTGLTVAFIGAVIAVVTLITSGRYALEILKKVDYKTLLFFVGLFMVVGGLEQTGILEVIAGFIGDVSGGNLKLMVAIILWVSAVAERFCRQYSVCGNYDTCNQEPCRDTGRRCGNACVGIVYGYGYRRKRDADRRVRQRCRHFRSREERLSNRLGQILQDGGSGNHHCGSGIHAVYLCTLLLICV